MVPIYHPSGGGLGPHMGLFYYFGDLLVMVHLHTKFHLSSFSGLEKWFSCGDFELMMASSKFCIISLNY